VAAKISADQILYYEVKQIIEIINIKESTLRYHKQNIDGKLGVHSLKQLLQYAASMKEAKGEPDALWKPRCTSGNCSAGVHIISPFAAPYIIYATDKIFYPRAIKFFIPADKLLAKGGIAMDNLLEQMGKRLTMRRKQLGLTQEILSERAEPTIQTIYTAEDGKKALRPENIVKLCGAL